MSTYENGKRWSILVALDGSPAAATALPTALRVAAQLGADCQALHIISDSGPIANLSRPFAQSLERMTGIKLWQDMVAPTVQLLQTLAAPGSAILRAFLHTEVRLDVGDPAAGIVRASADPQVALVVLTTHGHVIEPGRTLGRVAEQVAAAATRPILLIRPEAATASSFHGTALQRLLLPIDGTPTTFALLSPATELARQLGAAVDLLYVADPGAAPPDEPGSLGAPRYVDQPQHEWPQWASEVIARLGAARENSPPDVPTRVFLARGEIGLEIARFAAEQQSDVVALARRSHFEPGRAQVLRTVLDQTPCPVLLLGGAPD
jgi:nucleotide-binding universal stress UspA family protein